MIEKLKAIKENIKERKDLRNKMIFTIDSDHTKDIDDAISLEKLANGNYKLGVHIKESLYNKTSMNTNTKVNQMYPIFLPNEIYSLTPGKDCLATSYEMEYSPNGKLVNFDVFKSMINSKKQMTHEKVNKILEENEIPEGYEDYVENLKEMQTLASILQKNRVKRGNQNFDLPKVKIITDDEGKITEISQREVKTAEIIMEIFMQEAFSFIKHNISSEQEEYKIGKNR